MPTEPQINADPSESIYERQSAMLASALERDPEAWELLVQNYSPLVYGTATRLGLAPEDAADVAQSVWLALLEASAGIRDSRAVPRWLAVTARRLALKRQRAHAPSLVPMSEELQDPAKAADRILEEEERIREVRRALDGLSPRKRRLLLSLFSEDFPRYEVVAQKLGIPVGSIGPTRARCLAELYRILQRNRLLDEVALGRGEP